MIDLVSQPTPQGPPYGLLAHACMCFAHIALPCAPSQNYKQARYASCNSYMYTYTVHSHVCHSQKASSSWHNQLASAAGTHEDNGMNHHGYLLHISISGNRAEHAAGAQKLNRVSPTAHKQPATVAPTQQLDIVHEDRYLRLPRRTSSNNTA
jgi:hypothetical protein